MRRVAAITLLTRVLALWLVLGVSSPWAWAQTQAVDTPWQRSVGPLEISVTVAGEEAAAMITLTLNGALIDQRRVSADAPMYRVDAARDGATATGHIVLDIGAAPKLSALAADLDVSGGEQPAQRFRGRLGTWLWPSNLIYVTRHYPLSSELSADTAVRGAARNIATVSLYAGSLLMYQLTLTQTSPVATLPADIKLGDVAVMADTRFTLTVPTDLQKGSVLMSGKFASGTTPVTSFSSTIATWSPPPTPQP